MKIYISIFWGSNLITFSFFIAGPPGKRGKKGKKGDTGDTGPAVSIWYSAIKLSPQTQ